MSFYDSIKLEKGMYATAGRSFSEILESIDPSENYEKTELAGLDAYQRQLKRFDIKVGGKGSDLVEKFFKTTDSAALFPEYVSRAVNAGLEDANILPNIIATVTKIEGMDYRTITSSQKNDLKEIKIVAEGAVIPETIIKTQENLVRLHKRGRMIVSSYEAIRFQRLDLFTVTLRQIGAYIARTQFNDAVNVLINGDGNGNPAVSMNVESANSLKYNDLIELWNSFEPYELNTMIVSGGSLKKILNLEEIKNPMTGMNFQATGTLATPLGAEIVKTTAMPNNKIIGLDKNCALEMVVASDVFTEYDKLIDRQLERAAITSIAGFAKINNEATKQLVITP